MKRVAIYCRVSTEAQAEEDKYSIPLQKEACINYCKARQWLISEIFIDPGFSGDNMNRPGLQSLLARIKEFDIVLVFRLDRISRRTKNTLHMVEDIFLKNNIDFISIQESFDTTTPQGRLFLQQLASFAQYERDCITDRMQAGRKARAKQGLFHGGPKAPIGYDYVNGKLVINEYEALQIKEIFNLYLTGNGVERICNILTQKKYTNKYGKWNYGKGKVVSIILDNVIYTGKIAFKGDVFDGQHEAIINTEIFGKVHAIREQRVIEKYKAYSRNSLLAGFLYCGQCGARYAKRTGSNNRELYKCYSRSKTTKHMIKDPGCKNKIWSMEQLDRIIEREISRKFTITPKRKEKKEKKDNKKEIIEKKITEIEKKINKLLDLYQIDGLSINEITEKIKKLHDEKKTLQENIEIQEEEKEEVNFEELKKQWELSDFSLQEKRIFIEKIIKKIVLNGDRWEIHWQI